MTDQIRTIETEATMSTEIRYVVLGVSDLNRSKKFYLDLGGEIENDFGVFVSLKLGAGSSSLGLYTREALAADAGVDATGSGFTGVTFHHIVAGSKQVDEVLAQAKRAGGKIAREASSPKWGGYFGYFSDPDGYFWKVAAPAEQTAG
jgi:predicted lactoylglutathione lyase